MGDLPEQQEVNLATLARLNAELTLNGERQMKLAERQGAMLAAAGVGSASSGASVVPGRLRLEKMKQDLAQLQGTYTESHPEIIRLEREIQALSMELSSTGSGESTADGSGSGDMSSVEFDLDLARLKADERRLKAAIDSLTLRIEGIPRIEQQLNRLTYDYDAAREEYLAFQKRYRDAVLAQSLEAEQNQEVKIVEVAIPPDFPSAPQKFRLFFVGFMLAAGFAGGMLLLVEQLNRTFHSTRELRKFTRIPVLASIANIQTSRDRWMARARGGLNFIMVAAGLFLLTAASYRLGLGGKQLVWAISG